ERQDGHATGRPFSASILRAIEQRMSEFAVESAPLEQRSNDGAPVVITRMLHFGQAARPAFTTAASQDAGPQPIALMQVCQEVGPEQGSVLLLLALRLPLVLPFALPLALAFTFSLPLALGLALLGPHRAFQGFWFASHAYLLLVTINLRL